MGCNLYKCGSAVFIEGIYIGPFETIQVDSTRDDMVEQCMFTLPMYAFYQNQIEQRILPEDRIRQNLKEVQDKIKPSARVDIFTWYYQLSYYTEEMPIIRQFSGFIKKVVDGFPSQIFCEDATFMLRFGKMTEDWGKSIKLKDIIEKVIPIAQTAFTEYRQSKQLTDDSLIPALTFDSTQSAEMELMIKSLKGVSPYEVLSRIMNMYVLYANVYEKEEPTLTLDGQLPVINYPSNKVAYVYLGLGIKEKNKTRPTIELTTYTNVIERDIQITNALFDNIIVQVNGFVNGKRVQKTKESGASGNDGLVKRIYSPLNTEQGLQEVADAAYAKLTGDINKGTISTVLYPHIRLFDYIDYVDTVFPDQFSRYYYCIGRSFSGSPDKGFIQKITVTDENFVL